MFKLITFFAILSFAYAGVLEAIARPVLAKHVEDYDPHPRYNFAYEVHDALTGDSKSQVESRDGDVVQGQYWLIDADGYKRIVDYTSDSVNGFNAAVRREPVGVAGHVAAPAIVNSAPIAVASPVAYSSPALIKSTPIASYSSAPAYALARGPAAIAATSYAAPAAYAQSAYAHPAAYAQPAYSVPAAYASDRLINTGAPAAILAQGSYASPAVYKTSSIGSYAAAGPSVYSNFHGTPLASSGFLKTAYAH